MSRSGAPALGKPSILLIAAAFSAAVLFVLVAGQTALWYDESNYLSFAQGVRHTGFPLFFMEPERPAFFLDSPPGLLYLLSVLIAFTSEPVFLRATYFLLFVPAPFLLLHFYLRRRGEPEATAIAALCVGLCISSGYFIIEFVQIRMDLPLASLSFLVLILVAAETASQSRPRRLLLCIGIGLLSAAAVLVKFQVVCLSGTLVLFAAAQIVRGVPWTSSVLSLAAHAAGVLVGLLVLAILVATSGGNLDLLLGALSSNLSRMTPMMGDQGRGPALVLLNEAQKLTIVSATLLLAFASGRLQWRSDPLLILAILLAVIVAAFNFAVYRMPGASTYYMTQATIPLGYVFARSTLALIDGRRQAAIAAVAGLLVLNAILTFPLGRNDPQRWSSGIANLNLGEPDDARMEAERIAAGIGKTELILLDDWDFQGREIPFFADASERYGYLYMMEPTAALALLEREGPTRVGAIAFGGSGAVERLKTAEWSEVAAAIEARFELATSSASGTRWQIFIRRKGRSTGGR